MAKFKKLSPWIMLAVGVGFLVFFASRLSTSTYHNHLVRYGMPICSMDRHKFKDEHCSACGERIEDSGVFYSSAIAMDNPYGDSYQVKFSDYYNSFSEFKEDYDNCLRNSIFVGVWLFFDVGFSIHLIRCARRDNKLKSAGGK